MEMKKITSKINNRDFFIEYKILGSGKKVLQTVRNINTHNICNILSVRNAAKKIIELI